MLQRPAEGVLPILHLGRAFFIVSELCINHQASVLSNSAELQNPSVNAASALEARWNQKHPKFHLDSCLLHTGDTFECVDKQLHMISWMKH